MLLREIKETFEVENIKWYFPGRSKEVNKLVLDPFQKVVDKTMRTLKGKWNGHVYVFKTAEQQANAQAVMQKFAKDFADLSAKYPAGDRSLDASVADEYFKRLKTFDPTAGN